MIDWRSLRLTDPEEPEPDKAWKLFYRSIFFISRGLDLKQWRYLHKCSNFNSDAPELASPQCQIFDSVKNNLEVYEKFQKTENMGFGACYVKKNEFSTLVDGTPANWLCRITAFIFISEKSVFYNNKGFSDLSNLFQKIPWLFVK